MRYGIPRYRLPEAYLSADIDAILGTGVKAETGVSITGERYEQLRKEFDAVYIAIGAHAANSLGVPGEDAGNVLSAVELLRAMGDEEKLDLRGKRVVVVGGGNVAMDAVRTARRLGAEATIVYRRGEAELPARAEEVHHAKEEGIRFRMLTNPVEVLGTDDGWVRGVRCVEMELGEPDASGRRSPVVKAGSEFEIGCDVVIMALGTSPNPLLAATTAGLETDRRGCITADAAGVTSREGVFAGGDAVTGAATVILAMGAGRTAAKAIDEYVRRKFAE